MFYLDLIYIFLEVDVRYWEEFMSWRFPERNTGHYKLSEDVQTAMRRHP
jgi:hypothetical protein